MFSNRLSPKLTKRSAAARVSSFPSVKMWSSGAPDMSPVGATFWSRAFLCNWFSARGLGRCEECNKALDRAHGIWSEGDADGGALVCMQRLQVADGLCLGQRTERIEFPRDRDIGLHGVDEFEEQATIGATLMKLPGGMQIAGPMPCRGGHVMP